MALFVTAGSAGAAEPLPLVSRIVVDAAHASESDLEELWARRSSGHVGGRAAPEPVLRVIDELEDLLSERPSDLAASWKLLRALHFYGEYVLADEDEELAVFERARALADAARAALHARLELAADERDPDRIARAFAVAQRRGAIDRIDAASVYFYSAIHWGLWGERTGRMRAARQGVAGRIRDWAEAVVRLDERLADAGGHRFLGRLHTEAPKIPLFTGWVDRRAAVAHLKRACELAPEEPANQVYLADALLRFVPERTEEALRRLEDVVATPPRPHNVVEDAASIEEAKRLLASTS